MGYHLVQCGKPHAPLKLSGARGEGEGSNVLILISILELRLGCNGDTLLPLFPENGGEGAERRRFVGS